MVEKIKSATEAKQNKDYERALTELLYQMADDDFILAFRGSEWLGLAPHIEEDVAYSSISQNMMGHAFMYYQLLEDLGEGPVDVLAHGRSAKERKNAVLLEEANGTGTYLQSPKFDWAFSVVRHYFYDVYKKIKLDSLLDCSYEPLAHTAMNVRKEQYYHFMHWETWFKQLVNAGGEAKTRMLKAVEKVWADFGGVLSLGPLRREMADFRLIDKEELLRHRFYNQIGEVFDQLGLPPLPEPGMKRGGGRSGEHTLDLTEALATLGEVYRKDPTATW